MSMSTIVRVLCDKSVDAFDGEPGQKAREVRAAAKAEGWKLGREKDFCPQCAEAIKIKVAEIQSGA